MGLTDVQVIAAAGFLLPLLIAVLKRASYPDYVNALIAVGTYAVLAVIVTLVQGAFDAQRFIQNLGLVFGSGTIGYVALWKATLDPTIVTKVNG
jgi:hypothetical protein